VAVDPRDGSVFILLSHCMVELSQLAQGIGLGAYAARGRFHDAASALVRRSCAGIDL
jgi:hypothetical protein